MGKLLRTPPPCESPAAYPSLYETFRMGKLPVNHPQGGSNQCYSSHRCDQTPDKRQLKRDLLHGWRDGPSHHAVEKQKSCQETVGG